jgi:hypothetical protein
LQVIEHFTGRDDRLVYRSATYLAEAQEGGEGEEGEE